MYIQIDVGIARCKFRQIDVDLDRQMQIQIDRCRFRYIDVDLDRKVQIQIDRQIPNYIKCIDFQIYILFQIMIIVEN